MASNLGDLSAYTLPESGPQATLSITLSTPGATRMPLDPSSSATIPINLSVRQIQSRQPDTPLTIGAQHNIFDPSLILDVNALALTREPTGLRIPLHTARYSPSIRPRTVLSWGRDIRDSVDFVSVPSMQSGEALTLAFELSMEKLRDMWAHRSMRKALSGVGFPFVSPGKWRLHFLSGDSMGHLDNGVVLWTWGGLEGELLGKKFEYPTETRYDYDAEAEERMDRERREGKYVQLHPNFSVEVEHFVKVETDTQGVMIEFIDSEK